MSVGDGKDGDEDAMGEEPGDSFDSRRRDRRASLVLPLEYRNAGHLLVSYCTNLSRGGLFLPTPEPLPVGATVTLVLRVPNRDRPVTLEAKVRWIRDSDSTRGPAGMVWVRRRVSPRTWSEWTQLGYDGHLLAVGCADHDLLVAVTVVIVAAIDFHAQFLDLAGQGVAVDAEGVRRPGQRALAGSQDPGDEPLLAGCRRLRHLLAPFGHRPLAAAWHSGGSRHRPSGALADTPPGHP